MLEDESEIKKRKAEDEGWKARGIWWLHENSFWEGIVILIIIEENAVVYLKSYRGVRFERQWERLAEIKIIWMNKFKDSIITTRDYLLHDMFLLKLFSSNFHNISCVIFKSNWLRFTFHAIWRKIGFSMYGSAHEKSLCISTPERAQNLPLSDRATIRRLLSYMSWKFGFNEFAHWVNRKEVQTHKCSLWRVSN